MASDRWAWAGWSNLYARLGKWAGVRLGGSVPWVGISWSFTLTFVKEEEVLAEHWMITNRRRKVAVLTRDPLPPSPGPVVLPRRTRILCACVNRNSILPIVDVTRFFDTHVLSSKEGEERIPVEELIDLFIAHRMAPESLRHDWSSLVLMMNDLSDTVWLPGDRMEPW